MSNIKREAGYMYLESRKLLKLNEKIKDASKEVHYQKEKYLDAKDSVQKMKKQNQYEKAVKYLHILSNDHHQLLSKLSHHHLNFEHFLRKEHNAPK